MKGVRRALGPIVAGAFAGVSAMMPTAPIPALAWPTFAHAEPAQGGQARVGDALLRPLAFGDLAGWPDDDHAAAFAAFRRTWTIAAKDSPPSPLEGVYIWNWYGYGGPASNGYTPRGKPAVDEIKLLLQEL